MKQLLLISFLLILMSPAVIAGTYAEYKGDVYHQETHVKDFKITGDGKQKLKLTMACDANKSGGGSYRVYFYKRSPQGGWDQIEELRQIRHKDLKKTSDYFYLPPGDYKLQVKVRRMKYEFKLEDA